MNAVSDREKLEKPQGNIVPDDCKTGEKIETPRGSFSLTDMTLEQMKATGYGYHHSSDDNRYHIMANGTQAFAILNDQARTYEIYQLRDGPERRNYAFESLARIRKRGLTVDIRNYEKVYSGTMRPSENLESIYTRFNTDHPKDFTGHSLSVSDVVVIRQNGKASAHYCDSFGFAEIPEFFEAEQSITDDCNLSSSSKHSDSRERRSSKSKRKNEPEL